MNNDLFNDPFSYFCISTIIKDMHSLGQLQEKFADILTKEQIVQSPKKPL